MKKLILGILMLVSMILTSCGIHDGMSNSIKFEVVDTIMISDGYFKFTEYHVIIKMDSSYYSARMDKLGNLYKIDRKLKIKQ